MPDNSAVPADELGILRLSIFCQKHRHRFIVPLLHTLFVPGLRAHLLSVPAFLQAGHQMHFANNSVHIYFSSGIELIVDHYLINYNAVPSTSLLSSADRDHSFANMVFVNAINTIEDDENTPTPDLCKCLDLEVMHQHLGHPSFQSLIAASDAHVWHDICLVPQSEPFCISCKIGAIRSANRGFSLVSHATKPGQILFGNIISNPSTRGGLSAATHFKFYLILVCAYSRYTALIGTNQKCSSDIIGCINYWSVYHCPFHDFNIPTHLSELHFDAGSELISDSLIDWAIANNIRIAAAAPRHQEQNGLCERRWQAIRLISFKLLGERFLGERYHYHSPPFSQRRGLKLSGGVSITISWIKVGVKGCSKWQACVC